VNASALRYFLPLNSFNLKMSVTIINRKDINKVAEDAQRPTTPIIKSFYEVFGTSGCSLNCQASHNHEQSMQNIATMHPNKSRSGRRERWQARAGYQTELDESQEEWFEASKISASAGQGCGSCGILYQLIKLLFPDNHIFPIIDYEYSISHEFAIRRRPKQEQESVEVIELFQPSGMRREASL
jgi:hypothetical protein